MKIDLFWLSVAGNVLGILWSIFRERHIHEMTNKFAQLSIKMVSSIRKVSEAMKTLGHAVSEDKAMTRDKREQILNSVQQTEERISALIRDIGHNNVINIGDQQNTTSTSIKGAQNIVGSNTIDGGQNYDEGQGSTKHRG